MNDAARRREIILSAAGRLLRHYGPQKTTIADVAREAGVGVGTVYLEFPSKDALVEELSRSGHRAVLDAMRTAAGEPGRSFRRRLADVFDARMQSFLALVDEGAHACDLVHCASPAVKAAQANFIEEEHALICAVLRAGAETSEILAPEPEATARVVLRAYATFAPPWLLGCDRGDVQQAIAAMHDLVLHGLLARPAVAVPVTPKAARANVKAAPDRGGPTVSRAKK